MDNKTREIINNTSIDYLKAYIKDVKPYFEQFFLKQKEMALEVDPMAVELVNKYQEYIGGKHLRGALTKLGYDMYGGTQTEDILKVSSIIDVIHSFALMHDDIYDQDDLRRKRPAMHIQFEQEFDKSVANGTIRDKELYGISMATNLGDAGSYYANLILLDTNFDAELKLKFLNRLSRIIIQTVYGQALDIEHELSEKPTEESVMLIHERKTAWYTIPGPLQYGALLAGIEEDDSRYKAIERYGVPVGIAFQLRDDELGMFSKPEKFGKPIYSDLRQGKNTLLFAKAFENASEAELKELKAAHGNSDVNEEDLQRVNEILINTGALAYSKELSAKLVEEGKKHIKDITDDKDYQDKLELVADFMITRES